nr:nitrilase-related carbon-nitrogen hydrolase [Amycolatopsis sp. DSM 110486]
MIVAVHQGPYEELPAALAAAAEGGAALVVTAEMITTGYAIGAAAVAERAEPADGALAQELGALAAEHGVALVYGYPERNGDAVYNSVQLLSAQGERLANYRKTHLFGDLDRGQFSPGADLVVQADLGGLRVGLLICYDVEFPEPVRARPRRHPVAARADRLDAAVRAGRGRARPHPGARKPAVCRVCEPL